MNNKFIYVCVLFGLTLAILLCITQAKTTTILRHTDTTDPDADGFWSRKTIWKSRWVKYWRPKAIYVPVWKKVWTPTVLNEYVPLPNAPTGWDNLHASKKSTS